MWKKHKHWTVGWSTHHILHLVLSLPKGMNSQAWCPRINASEAWVKQDSCLRWVNHLSAKSEPWPSKEEKSSIILIPWFGAFQVILWIILGFLISKMGSCTYPEQQVTWGSGISGQNTQVGGLVGHLPGHPAPFPPPANPGLLHLEITSAPKSLSSWEGTPHSFDLEREKYLFAPSYLGHPIINISGNNLVTEIYMNCQHKCFEGWVVL